MKKKWVSLPVSGPPTYLHTNLFLLVVLILLIMKFKSLGTAGVSQEERQGFLF